ncbi:hypothetical protein B0H14DRAFT_2621394 [Mycena olivaceomarginata]|nr:hypothetical protein B0H14DRAFT_2621394 [Mycena olivaceomarginata]
MAAVTTSRSPTDSFGVGMLRTFPRLRQDFAAAVLLPDSAAAAAALQRQYAVVVLAAHVELFGIAVIGGFNVGALYVTMGEYLVEIVQYFRRSGSLRQYGGTKTHTNIRQRQSATPCSGKVGTLQWQ